MHRLPTFFAAGVIAATAGIGLGITSPAHAAPQPEPPCCASEFDWAAPYATAMENHGLQDLMSDMGITSALAMEDACGLVPAIGTVATVEKIVRDYKISPGSAGKLVVAAADVCPAIRRYLG